MSEYQSVLVAIDFDGGAQEVLQQAAALCTGCAAKITVLNVVHNTVPMYGGTLGGSFYARDNVVFNEEEIRKVALSKMEKLVQDVNLPDHKLLVNVGRAVDVILDQARICETDLIVIGSHGRHGLGLLLGSTANGVLHRAKCDVLAVRIES